MLMDTAGRPAPAPLALTAQVLQVWQIELAQPPAVVQTLQPYLSVEEHHRAGRFYFSDDHRRFTVARGALRMILGRYLRRPPAEVRLAYGPHGKPELAEPAARAAVGFNLSHSRDQALCVVTAGCAVGVDLEYLRPIAPAELAARVFSQWERDIFDTLPEAQRPAAFFNAWTRKEAYLKAVGVGLVDALDQVEVTLAPGQPARLVRVAGPSGAAERWSLRALEAGPGYAAAVALEGPPREVRYWRWDPRG